MSPFIGDELGWVENSAKPLYSTGVPSNAILRRVENGAGFGPKERGEEKAGHESKNLRFRSGWNQKLKVIFCGGECVLDIVLQALGVKIFKEIFSFKIMQGFLTGVELRPALFGPLGQGEDQVFHSQ